MHAETAPIQLPAVTVTSLAVVSAWTSAFNARDVERLLALCDPDIELETHRGVQRGHDATRALVHRQTYGVAMHARPRRYLADATTVLVDTVIELRWVETGKLAETSEAAALFEVRGDLVSRFAPQPDLPSAVRAAGWSEASPTSHTTDPLTLHQPTNPHVEIR